MRTSISVLVALLVLAGHVSAASLAGVSFCGGTVTPGDPTDMDNQLGDMTLQAAVGQPASITTCSKGYLLAKCGDHESANKIFDKCIAAGYVGAMIWKALQYENGNGTEMDVKAAADLLRRAAQSDDPAYGPIGRMHYATVLYEGRGVLQDKDEAMKWFRQAAAEGNPEASDFLRTGYHTGARDRKAMGVGTPTDAALAPIASGPQPSDLSPEAASPRAPGAAPLATAMKPLATGETVPPPVPTGSADPSQGIRLVARSASETVLPSAVGTAWLLLVAFLGGLLFRLRQEDRFAIRVRLRHAAAA